MSDLRVDRVVSALQDVFRDMDRSVLRVVANTIELQGAQPMHNETFFVEDCARAPTFVRADLFG